MPVSDKRIDAYIENAAPFARPVLQSLRTWVHKYCPEVTETVKWRFPHFEYKGKILFSMAAFRQHCTCGFWLAGVMKDPDNILQTGERTAMGHLGRMTSIADLPAEKILAKYIKEAMQLIEQGIRPPKAEKEKNTPLETPDYVLKALKEHKKAWTTFENFAPSHRKEYIEWITEAKREKTRHKRIATMIEWLEEGRSRNWKYER